MFTGIIETSGVVKEVITNGLNKTFWIESSLGPELKVDQSICHDGACLTVEEIRGDLHRVTAVRETLERTTLNNWSAGTHINLERSVPLNGRLDGHLVQGHVDTVAVCTGREENGVNREYTFEFPKKYSGLVVEKGSIALNGISLTIYNLKKKSFHVTIVPFTFDHTNIRFVEKNDFVNLEFDLVGKYILRSLKSRN